MVVLYSNGIQEKGISGTVVLSNKDRENARPLQCAPTQNIIPFHKS